MGERISDAIGKPANGMRVSTSQPLIEYISHGFGYPFSSYHGRQHPDRILFKRAYSSETILVDFTHLISAFFL